MDLSGHERDKLFLSRAAKDVVDISYLSGADGIEDARAFAKADLDRDGFEDMVVVNRNAPLLRVYHNALGPSTKNHFVSLRLEGAKQRDAVGARITAKGCGMTQTREVAIGSGFATVNSMAVTLGLGTCTQLDELTVKFPGSSRTFKNVAADKFYRVVEGKGIQAVTVTRTAAVPLTTPAAATSAIAGLAARTPGHAPFVAIDLFATWCEACVRTAPRFDAITHALADQLDVVGVSVEPTDDATAVGTFAHNFKHAMLPFDQTLMNEVIALFDGTPPLPSTIVVERKTGAIVLQTHGVPTRSELERAVWASH